MEHVVRAAGKVRAMSQLEKIALADEVFEKQPNLLASCLVQPRLGVAVESLEFLLNILLVCFQAMKESSHQWPLISEDEQERQLQRMTGSVKFSEELADPALAQAARELYLAGHAEAPLLAFVLGECNVWLRDLAQRKVETEADKFVMMAAVNMVNCIAAANCEARG